ncbi:MAG: hypothetical protein JSR18_03695 [Proteobacteria bacterium]|nr:hypothetical protein [Pseudomonadota bacterium]
MSGGKIAFACCLAVSWTQAFAVEISDNGTGQVLIFPYYSIANGPPAFSTLITITNTTPNVKALRVRAREGRTGVPVAELNLYLGGHDSWTAGLLATESGAGWGTFDHSCTYPELPQNGTVSPFATSGFADDAFDSSPERLNEGYLEVLELGDYGPSQDAASGSIADAVTPKAGYPTDCSRLKSDTGTEAAAPTGGLAGSALVISALGGVSQAYAPTALVQFTDQKGNWALGPESYSLADAHPFVSVVQDEQGRTLRSAWPKGIDAVSAALLTTTLTGEFVLDDSTRSTTVWTIVMPTKWNYVRSGLASSAPFASVYSSFGACELVHNPDLTGPLFNREGSSVTHGCGYTLPPTRPFGAVCFSSSLVSFYGGLIPTRYPLASTYAASGDPAMATSIAPRAENGWGSLTLSDAPALACGEQGFPDATLHSMHAGPTIAVNPDGSTTTTASVDYYGLPAMGLALSTYYNGVLDIGEGTPLLSTYMSAVPLRRNLHVQ